MIFGRKILKDKKVGTYNFMYDSRLFLYLPVFLLILNYILDYNDSLLDENSIYLELIVVILHPKPNIKLKESEYE